MLSAGEWLSASENNLRMARPISKLFEFFKLIGQLKTTRRTGWVERKVNQPESVADHMYRMAVLSFLVDPKDGLNKDRCIKLSLVHDMAECIVGDLAPSDGVSKEEKHKREKAAMEHIKTLLPEETGDEMYKLWEEYEFQSSREAEFVKDLDKFDMVLQAHEYEVQDATPHALQDFFDSTKGKFGTQQVKEWVQELNVVRGEADASHQHKNENTNENNYNTDKKLDCNSKCPEATEDSPEVCQKKRKCEND